MDIRLIILTGRQLVYECAEMKNVYITQWKRLSPRGEASIGSFCLEKLMHTLCLSPVP